MGRFEKFQRTQRFTDTVPNKEEHVVLGHEETLYLLQEPYYLLQNAYITFVKLIEPIPALRSLDFLALKPFRHVQFAPKRLYTKPRTSLGRLA